MKPRLVVLELALLSGLAPIVFAADATSSRISFDNQCFTIDGKDTFIFSGSFHYFRCPKPLWADRFQKFKDAGFNCVETYIAWNWHEQQPPASVDDYSKIDLTDLSAWLDMAVNRFGFYVILRPGPYICAEWDGGGYPQWLVTKRPADARKDWYRSDDPAYLAWCKHWYVAAAKVAAPYQITRMPAGKPGVILWQIENEYNYAAFTGEVKLHQLQALAHDSRDAGIDVPLITCMTSDSPLFRQDPYLLQNVIECRNTYPNFNPAAELRDLVMLKDYQPEKPRMVTELQGGWFSEVGHQLSQDMGYTPQHLTHVTLVAWANGFTGTNYYMGFGGTNIGDWGAANKTTTYDYAAPIRESGGVGPRYYAACAMANFLKDHANQLIRSTLVDTDINTPQNLSAYLRKGKDGSQFLFLINNEQSSPARGDLRLPSGISGNIHYELDPYDARILYLPPGESDASKGKWYPQPLTPPARPTDVPAPVKITDVRRQVDPGPPDDSWKDLPAGGSIEDLGIFDRRFVFYRTSLPASVPSGSVLTGRLSIQHGLAAQLNGRQINFTRHGRGFVAAQIPDLGSGDNQLLVLFENGGRWNGGDGINDRCGFINPVIADSALLPRNFTGWKCKIETADPTNDVDVEPDQSWASVSVAGHANQVTSHTTAVLRAQINLSDADLATNGKIVTFGSLGGEHRVFFNGKEISPVSQNHYNITPQLRKGVNVLAVVITAGRQAAGIGGGAELDPIQLPESAPLHWQISGQTAGYAANWPDPALDDSKWEQTGRGSAVDPPAGPSLKLVWYRMRFSLPVANPHVWVPWKLHLEAVGNGFIYLNGHVLGRYWEIGPQSDFYLPECWLNFGPNSANVIALCMRPTKGMPQITAAEVSPYDDFAEAR